MAEKQFWFTHADKLGVSCDTVYTSAHLHGYPLNIFLQFQSVTSLPFTEVLVRVGHSGIEKITGNTYMYSLRLEI